MDLSLKTVALGCLSLSAPFSVVSDIFGYHASRRIMSLRRQLELLSGEGLNINVILVGVENFTAEDLDETEYAVQFAREIYANVGLCIRRIRWQQISVADAGGYLTIDSGSEAQDLTDDWNGPDSGYLDVFIVRAMNDADGYSSINGPCSKDDKSSMTGSVVSLNGDFDNSGNTLAHEIGHYLGLDHISDQNNFIGNDGGSNSNTQIFEWQGDIMKNHCYTNDIC